MAARDKIIAGIDIGTTNTRVAIAQRTGAQLNFGNQIEDGSTHSTITLGNGEIAVIKIPTSHLSTNPSNQIDEHFIGNVKDIIRNKIGRLPDHCIITIPAYFDQSQRQAIINASQNAQLPLLEITSEQIAAAISCLQNRQNNRRETVLIYDYGARSLDAAIIEVRNNEFSIRAICGDTSIGGEAIDDLIVNEMVRRFMENNPEKDPRSNPTSMSKLKLKAEEAKIQLSSCNVSRIVIPNYLEDLTLDETLQRCAFEFICDDIFSKITECIDSAIEHACISKDEITQLILLGGSSNIPIVRETIRDYFEDRIEPLFVVSPETAIAVGAAILCDKKLKQEG